MKNIKTYKQFENLYSKKTHTQEELKTEFNRLKNIDFFTSFSKELKKILQPHTNDDIDIDYNTYYKLDNGIEIKIDDNNFKILNQNDGIYFDGNEYILFYINPYDNEPIIDISLNDPIINSIYMYDVFNLFKKYYKHIHLITSSESIKPGESNWKYFPISDIHSIEKFSIFIQNKQANDFNI